jgi:hypothetical protein
MIAEGRLSPAAYPGDIEREMEKPYHHPVVEGTGHSPTERLPVMRGASAGHAECSDCHNPHQRIEKGRRQGFKVSGYSISGQYLETSVHEYEICLKCHSDRISSDLSKPSISEEFSGSVRSQHPVTTGASGNRIPSLSTGMPQGVFMTCSDCHTSDDPNGPRGPHGSNHRYLLSGNYRTDVYGEESSYAYEFCYSCHDRTSILANESFPLHREHIVGDPISGRSGTSCYTCHASHGSSRYPHLLKFNPEAVSPENSTRLTEFREMGSRSGQCYLSCHGHNHGPDDGY